MDDRVDLVRKAIGIKAIHSDVQKTGGLPGFFVTFTASDAETAQKVAHDIASLFLSQSYKAQEEAAHGATEFLQQQVDDAKRDLDEHDAKVAAFQQKNIGTLPNEQTQNGTMLTSLNTQLANETQELARLEQGKDLQQSELAQMLQQQQQNGTPGVVQTSSGVPVLQGDAAELAKLQSLESQLIGHGYTSDFPDVVTVRRQISDLKEKMAKAPAQQQASSSTGGVTAAPRPTDSLPIIQLRAQIRSVDIVIQAKRKEVAATQAAMSRYQALIAASPLVEEQFKDINRDYETAQKNYDELLVKLKHAQTAADLGRAQQGEQFTLTDDANLPEDPTFPNRQLFAGGGAFLGLMIGLALTAFLEYKDTALRTEQDVWAFTQLPTLAVIAYAGHVEVKHKKPGIFARFKGMFHRKTPPEMLSKAEG